MDRQQNEFMKQATKKSQRKLLERILTPAEPTSQDDESHEAETAELEPKVKDRTESIRNLTSQSRQNEVMNFIQTTTVGKCSRAHQERLKRYA